MPGFTSADLQRHASRTNQTATPRKLSLYTHVPYCVSPCFYCGCNRIITRDQRQSAPYVERLLQEAARIAPLFDPSRELIQMHFGGGTPNFLAIDQLARLLDGFGKCFRLASSAERDFSIELDPRLIRAGDIATYAHMGLNRASLGVQDFDREVQLAINREQSVTQTLSAIEECRAAGFRSVNVDLIYGLPRQTPQGFTRTLDILLKVRPDRVAIYGYAHLPELFRAQKQIDTRDLPDVAQRIELLSLAIGQLMAAGYRHIGLDHFALPGDDLSRALDSGSLHRNFMGYTTHADCDLIGLGVSAISHIGDSFSQNPRTLPDWEAAIDQGQLPAWRGISLSRDDIVRADVIQQIMCRGEVDRRRVEDRHGLVFDQYFPDALSELSALADDGLVELPDTRIVATSRGRLLLRTIAMCFDAYLKKKPDRPRHSRIV